MSSTDRSAFPLRGMRALVTGGGQGIGACICMGLASAGSAVAVVDRQADRAAMVAADITAACGTACAVTADLCDEDACRSAIANVVDQLGGLDILVNNAAPARDRTKPRKLTSVDWETHHKLILSAAVNLTDAASEHLAAGGRGAVVNVSSIIGSSIGMEQCSWPYHVSKAGLDHLTRWLAVRFGGNAIRVNAVAPGLVDRGNGYRMSDNPVNRAIIDVNVPLRRAGTGNDIAQAVVFLSSQQASYITGQVLVIDGGLGLSEVYGASLRALNMGTRLAAVEPSAEERRG